MNNGLTLTLQLHLLLFGIYVNQLVRFVKEYPYPNYFFNTAVGFSRSTLLQAKGKNIKPDRTDLWLQRRNDA